MQRKYRASFPEKEFAHKQVAKALRKGLLVRPDKCTVCNLKRRVESHHEDYAKPLEILWVCKACHVSIHRKLSTKEEGVL